MSSYLTINSWKTTPDSTINTRRATDSSKKTQNVKAIK